MDNLISDLCQSPPCAKQAFCHILPTRSHLLRTQKAHHNPKSLMSSLIIWTCSWYWLVKCRAEALHGLQKQRATKVVMLFEVQKYGNASKKSYYVLVVPWCSRGFRSPKNTWPKQCGAKQTYTPSRPWARGHNNTWQTEKHNVFHCFMLSTKTNSNKFGKDWGKSRDEVASFQLTTLQPEQQETSNAPAECKKMEIGNQLRIQRWKSASTCCLLASAKMCKAWNYHVHLETHWALSNLSSITALGPLSVALGDSKPDDAWCNR